MYQWILRRKGHFVRRYRVFSLCGRQHVNESGMIDTNNTSQAWMRFKTAIIPFVGDDSWAEAALIRPNNPRKTSVSNPLRSYEYGKFIEQIRSELETLNILQGKMLFVKIQLILRIINSELSRWLNLFPKNFITRTELLRLNYLIDLNENDRLRLNVQETSPCIPFLKEPLSIATPTEKQWQAFEKNCIR